MARSRPTPVRTTRPSTPKASRRSRRAFAEVRTQYLAAIRTTDVDALTRARNSVVALRDQAADEPYVDQLLAYSGLLHERLASLTLPHISRTQAETETARAAARDEARVAFRVWIGRADAVRAAHDGVNDAAYRDTLRSDARTLRTFGDALAATRLTGADRRNLTTPYYTKALGVLVELERLSGATATDRKQRRDAVIAAQFDLLETQLVASMLGFHAALVTGEASWLPDAAQTARRAVATAEDFLALVREAPKRDRARYLRDACPWAVAAMKLRATLLASIWTLEHSGIDHATAGDEFPRLAARERAVEAEMLEASMPEITARKIAGIDFMRRRMAIEAGLANGMFPSRYVEHPVAGCEATAERAAIAGLMWANGCAFSAGVDAPHRTDANLMLVAASADYDAPVEQNAALPEILARLKAHGEQAKGILVVEDAVGTRTYVLERSLGGTYATEYQQGVATSLDGDVDALATGGDPRYRFVLTHSPERPRDMAAEVRAAMRVHTVLDHGAVAWESPLVEALFGSTEPEPVALDR